MSGDTLSGGTVSLGVKPDTTGFGAKLRGGIESESSGLGGVGKKLGAGLMAGLGAAGIAIGVTDILKAGFDEFSQMDAINAQFAAGIKSTGNAAQLSVKGMDDLAESVSKYSGQTVTSIGKTEQVLQTFQNIKNVGPHKIFDLTTQAAANMAAKLGGDASSQAIRLGKALNDPIKGMASLTRIGVTFTAAQTKQIDAMQKSGNIAGAQGIILDKLKEKFGGAAKAAGDTFPGQIAKMKNAFDGAAAGVVKGLMPAIEKILPVLTKVVMTLIPTISLLIPPLLGIVKAVLPLVSMILPLLTSLLMPIIKLFMELLTPIIALIGPLLRPLIALLGAILTPILKALAPVLKILGPILSFIGTILGDWWGIIAKVVTWLAKMLLSGMDLKKIGPVFQLVGKIVALEIKGMQSVVAGLVSFFVGAWKSITTGVNVVGDTFRTVFKAVGGFISSSFSNAITVVKGAINGIIFLINTVIKALDKVQVNLPAALGGGTFGINIPTIPALANGGTLLTSGTVLVGERGPELLNLNKGATVTPLDKTSARPIYADGIGLIGWIKEQANKQAELVWNTGMNGLAVQMHSGGNA